MPNSWRSFVQLQQGGAGPFPSPFYSSVCMSTIQETYTEARKGSLYPRHPHFLLSAPCLTLPIISSLYFPLSAPLGSQHILKPQFLLSLLDGTYWPQISSAVYLPHLCVSLPIKRSQQKPKCWLSAPFSQKSAQDSGTVWEENRMFCF